MIPPPSETEKKVKKNVSWEGRRKAEKLPGNQLGFAKNFSTLLKEEREDLNSQRTQLQKNPTVSSSIRKRSSQLLSKKM